ncbi:MULTISPECIES: ABC transporter ATP-binding protein [Clostridium]|uniref:ABC transporter ATP-binding protein n=1 Tax=Clostridium cibarium TaxID=2762247 RepID=A0ABR8PUS3_9CLOT|nr:MULTISPECIES: ABC transporter ATP-binding protein [Clostridium]MBD7911928.1 ABC transporter ATP-binding protein [Clostridium cibarium]
MSKLVEITNMTKSFGKKVILKDVDIEINERDSIALVGHNGCGKSTLLKIICGLTSVSRGNIKYYKNVKFNYVPERFPKISITPQQYILRTALIEGLAKDEINKKSYELFREFFMENIISTPIKYLSKGSIQKVNVIQALITKPDILLLDEPLSGQDVDSQKVFIELVHKLINDGVAIVMSCHEEILINALSNVVYEVKEKNIQRRSALEKVNRNYDVLVFKENASLNEKYKNINESIRKVDNNGNEIKLFVSEDNSNTVLKEMINYGYKLRRMYNENF